MTDQDLINGLRKIADLHQCCEDILLFAANRLEELTRPRSIWFMETTCPECKKHPLVTDGKSIWCSAGEEACNFENYEKTQH